MSENCNSWLGLDGRYLLFWRNDELPGLERSLFLPVEFFLRGERAISVEFVWNNLCGIPHPPVLKLRLSKKQLELVFLVGESGAIENRKADLDDRRDSGRFGSGVKEPRGDGILGGDIRRSELVRFARGV